MSIEFVAVEMSRDATALVELLCGDDWPFHAQSRLMPDDVAAMSFLTDDVSSFWIVEGSQRVGLVRLLDLGDIDDGSPLFDLRIASAHRGHGLGKLAVRWLTQHLFTAYPRLHRIEANTRSDNVAMRRVLDTVGYTLEGVLRQAWKNAAGERFDTAIYGILRAEYSD